MHQIQINQLIRSRRRTIGLQISDDGELIVRAPLRASMRDIETLIREKYSWITRHQQDIQRKLQVVTPKQFIDGEKFLYLGEYYPLTIIEKSIPSLQFDQGFYLAATHLPKAHKIFLKWYWQRAQERITERVNWYATQENFHYTKIRINDAKRQWGSCNSAGRLSFTWRLIMAPVAVIDYLAVHELVHTQYKNHSERYWQKVAAILPSYKIHKKWLKDNDHLLVIS